MTRQDTP